MKTRFRPLIRGFFFYYFRRYPIIITIENVSVPSFGDSFFIILGVTRLL